MPTFEYQAIAQDGRHISGHSIGSSMDHVLGNLVRQGIQVTHIGLANNPNDPLSSIPPEPIQQSVMYGTPIVTAQAPNGPFREGPHSIPSPVGDQRILEKRSSLATHFWGPLVGQVGLTHLAFFFRQFGTMLKAGVPMVQSLDTLSGQAKDGKLRRILAELSEHVKAGRPVSYGMGRYPEVFSPVMLSLTRAGEEGGFLDVALLTLANYLDKDIALRNLYKRVTFYPKLVLFMSVIVVLGTNLIIAAVAPGSPGLSSPLTTLTTWLVLGPLLVAGFLFMRWGLANARVRRTWDAFILRIPYLGPTLRQLAMAKFGRAFGALYHGGVPIPDGLRMAADACGNSSMRDRILPSVACLQEGRGIAETLRSTHSFSPIVLDMVQTGETTGNLDQMLTSVSEYYEQEAQTRSEQIGHVTGVVVYVAVAIYVGFMVVSFYGGYFSNLLK